MHSSAVVGFQQVNSSPIALHCASEAAKAQDKFSRYELFALAESYRMLSESTALLERSAKVVETVDKRRKPQGRAAL